MAAGRVVNNIPASQYKEYYTPPDDKFPFDIEDYDEYAQEPLRLSNKGISAIYQYKEDLNIVNDEELNRQFKDA